MMLHNRFQRYLLLKGWVDITGAFILCIILLPLFCCLSLIIYLSDGAPILYRHQRMGMGGKLFTCLKFRTMKINTENVFNAYLDANPHEKVNWEKKQKLTHDPRLIPGGKFLRSLSLDELAQLLNVMAGEMSLIGPRPVTKSEYDEKYGRWATRCFSIKPGISGLWQVSGRNEVSYRRRVSMDLYYVRHQSLCLDFLIAIKTVMQVILVKGR